LRDPQRRILVVTGKDKTLIAIGRLKHILRLKGMLAFEAYARVNRSIGDSGVFNSAFEPARSRFNIRSAFLQILIVVRYIAYAPNPRGQNGPVFPPQGPGHRSRSTPSTAAHAAGSSRV
jgi:hypothetical protein